MIVATIVSFVISLMAWSHRRKALPGGIARQRRLYGAPVQAHGCRAIKQARRRLAL
jgi:hypothetical protein